MEINSTQRLFIRAVVLPVILLSAFFIAGGVFLYWFGYPYVLKNVHGSYLTSYLSEKRYSIDLWAKQYREELEKISKLDTVKNFVSMPASVSGDVSKLNIDKTAELNINKVLEDQISNKRFRVIAVLSKEGTVLKSTNPEFIDEEWLSRPVFANIVTFLKGATALGFHEGRRSDSGLVFLTPIMGINSDIIGFIYASTDTKEMANFLTVRYSVYDSLKIELIDKDGSVALTKEGVPRQKEKYDIKAAIGVLGITDSSLQLIAVVNKYEIHKPLILVLSIYSLFGLIITLSIMLYNSRFIKKTRASMPSSSDKPLIDKGGIGESRESLKNQTLDMLLFHRVSKELRNALNSMFSDAQTVLSSEGNLTESSTRSLIRMKNNLTDIIWLIDNLSEIAMPQRSVAEAYEEFNLCDLLKEINDSSKELATPKAVELIFDCPDVFRNNAVYADRNCLKTLLQNLMIAAVKSTNAGTVTLLASQVAGDDGSRLLEVSVADTGKGFYGIPDTPSEISDLMLENMYSEIKVYSNLLEYASIFLSKRLAYCMKGKLAAESIKGKGSVFTVRIPLNH